MIGLRRVLQTAVLSTLGYGLAWTANTTLSSDQSLALRMIKSIRDNGQIPWLNATAPQDTITLV
jgi:hypothetical protein